MVHPFGLVITTANVDGCLALLRIFPCGYTVSMLQMENPMNGMLFQLNSSSAGWHKSLFGAGLSKK